MVFICLVNHLASRPANNTDTAAVVTSIKETAGWALCNTTTTTNITASTLAPGRSLVQHILILRASSISLFKPPSLPIFCKRKFPCELKTYNPFLSQEVKPSNYFSSYIKKMSSHFAKTSSPLAAVSVNCLVAITELVTGVKTPTYIIVHKLEAVLTERALGPRPQRQGSVSQGFSAALPVISLPHSKLITGLYALPDQDAQISFSLLSLNTARDAAQGTVCCSLGHSPFDHSHKCEIFRIYSQKSSRENCIRTSDCFPICFWNWLIKKLFLQLNFTLERTLESHAITVSRWILGSTPEPETQLPTVK